MLRRTLFALGMLLGLNLAFAADPVKPQGFESVPYKEQPLTQLNDLISSTEKLVQHQKELRDQLTQYIVLHDAYLKDIDNRAQLLKTAKVAQQALDTIKSERMTHLFDPSFLSEMTLFAKLAKRPTIEPPK